MGVDFSKMAAAPANASTAAPAAQDKPKAQVWLNVGMTVPIQNENGEVEEISITLPLGIPIDTQESAEMTNSAKMNQLRQAKNYLLETLQEAGKALKPGESEPVNGLELSLFRVGKREAPVAGDNPLLAAMAGRLGKTAA